MTTLAEELEVRERSSLSSSKGDSGKASSCGKGRHTLATLVVKGQLTSCPYCQKGHAPEQCHLVSSPEVRKQFMRGAGRCFVCLKRGHLSNKCHSGRKFAKCTGFHHISIFTKSIEEEPKGKQQAPVLNLNAVYFEKTQTHNIVCGRRCTDFITDCPSHSFQPILPR